LLRVYRLGRLIRVWKKGVRRSPATHLYYPNRRHPSPAFAALLAELRPLSSIRRANDEPTSRRRRSYTAGPPSTLGSHSTHLHPFRYARSLQRLSAAHRPFARLDPQLQTIRPAKCSVPGRWADDDSPRSTWSVCSIANTIARAIASVSSAISPASSYRGLSSRLVRWQI